MEGEGTATGSELILEWVEEARPEGPRVVGWGSWRSQPFSTN